MVRSKLNAAVMTLTVSLIPFLLALPTASASHEDHCAGGVDASESLASPTPLQVFAGCKGALYKSPGSSGNHEDDFKDVYSIRINGTGVDPKLHFRLCNEGANWIYYQIDWKTDLMPMEIVVQGHLAGGNCTAAEPQTFVGGAKPGVWIITISGFSEIMKSNESLPYYMYGQPLWR